MNQPKSKLCVIIGGGNGIGAACCYLMVKMGWDLAVVDLDIEQASKVASEVGGKAYTADLGDLNDMEKLSKLIERDQGPIASLVVSAAMFQDKFTPAEFPVDLYRKVIDVNITGTFFANRVFGTEMSKRGYGTIVNIASDSAIGGPLHAYGPAKAAVITLTRNLAAQWGGCGVRVNSVSPGATRTQRVLNRPKGRYAENIEKYFALGRPAMPMEIAQAVEFLASDRASAITGIDLLVDCGMSAGGRWGMYGGIPSADSMDSVV
jgi:NAD(P)-dependent dehydrogenase (short-subunit alcohol dehydrogenase family)